MQRLFEAIHNAPAGRRFLLAVAVLFLNIAVTMAVADVIDRTPPSGTVPNPGTQQQELANITAPTPYNVYEFVGTCAACHGGAIDQMAGHFSNWAGTSMASSARDPIFRANQIGVEIGVENAIGQAGAGNICFRCHSPNGWMSGRFDPQLAGGDPKGSTMIHSILLSTDDEGILCEGCHRTMGNVTFGTDTDDAAERMLSGIDDWPHEGEPYADQAGDPTIAFGNPYGDTTLQVNDGMLYIGKYSGSVDLLFSDLTNAGGNYTGQTYAVDENGDVYVAPDGSIPLHYELPISVPLQGNREIFQAQAISLEHPTAGFRPKPLKPQPVPPGNSFIRTPEFCGSCHELVIPILNHGMPEQRTYSEWKFSDFGQAYANDPKSGTRCQDCHMPTMMHEFADDTRVSVNPDPGVTGWFPYAKDRNIQYDPDEKPGTAFHKFAGANRDLPMMMKFLYPEPDLELIGARTGNDPRIFPGMLSTRDPMFDRAQRNTEVSLADAVDVEIVNGPSPVVDNEGNQVCDDTVCQWQVRVRVTNNSGHRIPSGYPDGRRFWIELNVTDESLGSVYQSGYYDEASATLHNDLETFTPGPDVGTYNRALEPLIDATGTNPNAVMVYERVTGTCTDGVTDPGTGEPRLIFPNPTDPAYGVPVECFPSPSLLNNFILFDNRILPAGFDYAALRESGVKFWNYDPNTMVPYEQEPGTSEERYPDGQNWDVVTYRFEAPVDAINLNARAEVYWQTHTREFMEHLRTQDTSTLRPEGPINAFMPGYPDTANYLSEEIGLSNYTAIGGSPLNDNWGGIAYAAWKETGKGAPYLAALADTNVTTPPVDPDVSAAQLPNPYEAVVSWSPEPDADGYLVWIRYGVAEATAAWDKLAVVQGTSLSLTALNVGKTYGFRVQAFNAAGYSPGGNAISFTTAGGLPAAPDNLRVVSAAEGSVELTWFDLADNEAGFIIQRQTVTAVPGDFVEVGRAPAGDGAVNWTDTDPALTADNCYVYRVAAYNPDGQSAWTFPVTACIGSAPDGTVALVDPVTTISDPAPYRHVLNWTYTSTNTVVGYRIERTNLATSVTDIIQIADPTATTYADTAVDPAVGYCYVVFAYNYVGNSLPSNQACSATTTDPPAAPSGLTANLTTEPLSVTLDWADNATDEDNYVVERSDNNGPFAEIARLAAGAATYTDSAVGNGNTYAYRVAAVSNLGGMSAYSNTVTVVTGEIPQAPSGLAIVRERKDAIQISWLDNAINEQTYHVERSLDGATFTEIDILPADTTAYTDSAVVRKTTYWYRVRAYNPSGFSGYTDVVSGTTK